MSERVEKWHNDLKEKCLNRNDARLYTIAIISTMMEVYKTDEEKVKGIKEVLNALELYIESN